MFDDLVCESGRVLFFELAMPCLDRAKAARVEFGAIAGPVLVIAGGCDRIVPGRLARRTAARYRNATYVEIPGSDTSCSSGRRYPSPWATSTGSQGITCSQLPSRRLRP